MPAEVNKFFEKINVNFSILNEERNTLLARIKSFQLRILNNSRQPLKAHSNNIVRKELWEYCISKAATVVNVKTLQVSAYIYGSRTVKGQLCESIFLKYSICEEKSFVKTSKCVCEENSHAEISMKAV